MSRLRLRRTRQRPVWISNGVLVLRRRSPNPGEAATKADPASWRGVVRYPAMRQFADLAVSSNSWVHLDYPGAPARVANQEKGCFKRCPLHVFGSAAEVIASEGGSSRRLQRFRRNRGTVCGWVRRSRVVVVAPPPAVPGTPPRSRAGNGWPSNRTAGCAQSSWGGHATRTGG